MARVGTGRRKGPASDLAGLETQSMEALREEWQRLFRIEALPRISRTLLLRGIAWRVQEEAEGGLSKRVARQLRQADVDCAPDCEAVEPSDRQPDASVADGVVVEPGPPYTPVDNARPRMIAIALKPGTRLLREWQGRAHEVIVLPDGYLWKGERYSSLSVIAERITGAHWSGPRFFGVRKAVAPRGSGGGTSSRAPSAPERSRVVKSAAGETGAIVRSLDDA